MSRQIVIEAYNPGWPQEFDAVGSDIRAALGDYALAIHHIGSTSVPGLPAKDIIDVQVAVANLEDPRLGGLEKAGFLTIEEIRSDHCPPGMDIPPDGLGKRFFYREPRRVNVHIRRVGCFNQRYALLWRDYIRTHASAANAYAEVKRQLAAHFPTDQDAYYDIKDPVCDIIMAAAFDWAATGWEPAGTDA